MLTLQLPAPAAPLLRGSARPPPAMSGPHLRRHGPAPAAPFALACAAPQRPRCGEAFRGDRDGRLRPAEEGGEPVEHIGVLPTEPRARGT